MRIELQDIAKKYHRSYLFRNINLSFDKGTSYAILGPNGSGKSTLLKIISGYVSATKGKVLWYDDDDKEIERVLYHQYFSFTSPYLELFDELNLEEHLRLHFQLKKMRHGITLDGIIERGMFQEHRKKLLKHFSSGMLQRLKLCMALFSNDPILLLDEPCTNLDETGVNWYRDLVQSYIGNKLVIIASNQAHEYDFCDKEVRLNE